MKPERKRRRLFASGILLLLVSLAVTVALADGSRSGGSYAVVDVEKVVEGLPKDKWPDGFRYEIVGALDVSGTVRPGETESRRSTSDALGDVTVTEDEEQAKVDGFALDVTYEHYYEKDRHTVEGSERKTHTCAEGARVTIEKSDRLWLKNGVLNVEIPIDEDPGRFTYTYHIEADGQERTLKVGAGEVGALTGLPKGECVFYEDEGVGKGAELKAAAVADEAEEGETSKTVEIAAGGRLTIAKPAGDAVRAAEDGADTAYTFTVTGPDLFEEIVTLYAGERSAAIEIEKTGEYTITECVVPVQPEEPDPPKTGEGDKTEPDGGPQDEGDKTEPDGGSQDEGDKTESDGGSQDEGDKTEPDGGSQDEGDKTEPDGGSQDEGDKTEPDGGSQDEGDKTEPDGGSQDEGDKTEPDGGSQDEGGKAEPDGGSQGEGGKAEPDSGPQDEGDKTEPDGGSQDEGDKTEPDGGSQGEGGKAEPDGGSSDGADAPAAGEEQEAPQEEHRIVRAIKNTRTLGFSLEVTYPDAVAESTDGGKTTYKVTASGVTITKPQKGGIDDGGRGYSFVVTGPDGTKHVTTLKAGETKTVDGLGTGIYTVEEVDTAHTAIFRTPGNVVYANEIDVPTVVIINNYRPKEFGAYRVVHEYYKNSVAAENLQGRSEIAVVADLPLDGTAYVKEENPNAVEQPDFKGTTYKYHSVVYGTMEEGDRYSPDSTMTGVTATEDGGEIIILRYVRSTNPTSHETRLTVRKVWKGDEAKDRPEEIKVKIFRDGEDWKTIVLTARDGWRWSDSVANAEHTYQVEEVAGGEIEGAYTVDNGQPVELKVDGSATITITNTKKDPEKGNLTIAKTVAGGSTEQAFQFTVVLSDTTVSGTVDGVAFTDGKATISLRHGESRTIHGLPAGIEYSVTETGAEGYTVTAKGETGIVPAGGEVKAEFVNSLDSQPQTGGLTIAKTVTGIGDQERRFTFTVILSDSSISGTFGGMEFTGGTAFVQLRSGESVSASGLPAGVRYTVTESGANEKGYITTASGEAGTIPAGGSASVSFTNHVPEDHTPQWDPEEEEWEYIDDDEVPLSDTDPEPQTGDGSLTRLWAAVCVVSLLGGAALILTAIFKKKS